jgi:hypothetical protein
MPSTVHGQSEASQRGNCAAALPLKQQAYTRVKMKTKMMALFDIRVLSLLSKWTLKR